MAFWGMDYYRHDLMYRSGAIVTIMFVGCVVGCVGAGFVQCLSFLPIN